MNRSSTTDDGSIVDKAKQTASNVTTQAKEGVTHQIEVRKEKAVSTIHDVAEAVRKTGQKLDEPLPKIADRAADGIERLSRFLESHEIKDAVRSIERFARREPALFLGGAVALGLAAGRFLKSSALQESAGSAGIEREGFGEDEPPYIGEEEVDVGYEAYGYGEEDVGDEGAVEDEPMAFEGEERRTERGGSGSGSEQ